MNVFIHGWSFSKQIWKDFFKLENSLFLDLPFHGNQNLIFEKKIIDSYIDYIEPQIKDRTNIIGWSLGASIAVKFALTYPKKVRKLILIGFSPKFKDKELGHDPKIIKAFMLSLKKDFNRTVYDFRKLSSDEEFREIPLPEKNGAINILKEFIDLDLTDHLKKINHQVIIIHGRQDKVINPKASIFTHNEIKKSKLILTDANHSPFLYNPDIIVNHL